MKKNLKLNQVIAIANGEKSRRQKVITKIYQALEKKELFEGFTKTFKPVNEDGEKFPSEQKNVLFNVSSAIADAVNVSKEMFNIVATLDVGNCSARADVVVDDVTVIKDVPVTHLLFLEKQLIDLQTFVNSFPVLDPTEKWGYKSDFGFFTSDPSETHRTKKVPKPIVLYEATDKHPAQTEMYNEDIIIGHWTQIKHSGCIPKDEKELYMEKIRKLSRAVKIAREEANSIAVETSGFGDDILDYIFS